MIQFSHRDDATRTASIEQTDDNPLTYVVHHTDASGKARKKTFKGGYPHDKALRFVLNTEGYIVRPPQDHPIQWMTKFVQPYVGVRPFAVGHNVIWTADGSRDTIHRVTPDTMQTESVQVGSDIAQIATTPGGGAVVLVREYQKVDDQMKTTFIIKVVDGDTLEVRSFEPTSALAGVLKGEVIPPMIGQISVAGESILGPHSLGAALYSFNGDVQRVFEIALGEVRAMGAMSGDGSAIVLTCAEGLKMIVENHETIMPANFSSISNIQITDAHEVYVSGFQYPSHGTFRVAPSGTTYVSRELETTIHGDGSQMLSVRGSNLCLEDPHGSPEEEMEIVSTIRRFDVRWIGTAKRAKAHFWGDSSAIIFNDAYTLSEVLIGL